jgi:hypothetical protein
MSLQSLKELIGVNIWSQMGCENIRIGLCKAGKINRIKKFKGVPVAYSEL